MLGCMPYGGEYIESIIDEQIIFDQLGKKTNAVWSLLLASGYLKVLETIPTENAAISVYRLVITNLEVKTVFEQMIKDWFGETPYFEDFVDALFKGDEIDLNEYMYRIALNVFSTFDTADNRNAGQEPERFYHGLVLGLLVDRTHGYILKSNRESGYGRYDVILEPKDVKNKAVIIEFKVLSRARGEKSLEDTAANALKQIEDKKYDTDLLSRGIPKENILKYGFAFEGEKCLIRRG